MNIAFIADDSRKELLSEFCIAYSLILSGHKLCGTATTGTIIKDTSDLDVELLSPGELGFQQIIAKAAYNEIDMVIYFRNSINPEIKPKSSEIEVDFEHLVRTCDANLIPLATNIATAELLIRGLERGDLDWRSLL
jgi:methylglyoxal synthase